MEFEKFAELPPERRSEIYLATLEYDCSRCLKRFRKAFTDCVISDGDYRDLLNLLMSVALDPKLTSPQFITAITIFENKLSDIARSVRAKKLAELIQRYPSLVFGWRETKNCKSSRSNQEPGLGQIVVEHFRNMDLLTVALINRDLWEPPDSTGRRRLMKIGEIVADANLDHLRNYGIEGTFTETMARKRVSRWTIANNIGV